MSTILVLQADSELSDGWCLALEASGHTVLSAAEPSEGLARLREGGVDVVVFDGPGGADGLYGFVEELQRLPDSPPLVLVSESPEAPQISARIGAAAFLPKPCSSGDLDDAVARLSPTAITQAIRDAPTEPRQR